MVLSEQEKTTKARQYCETIATTQQDRLKFYAVTPVSAPRQVGRDAYKPSKHVQRYRAFRDEVRWRSVQLPPDYFHAVFLLPIPAGWSEKRRRLYHFQPHRPGIQADGTSRKEAKPDADNLAKALIDAVYRLGDDSAVWHYTTTKLWSMVPGILISPDHLDGLHLETRRAKLADWFRISFAATRI